MSKLMWLNFVRLNAPQSRATRLNPLRFRGRLTPALIGIAMLLSACGFTMRGQDLGLPFKSVMVEGAQGTAAEVVQILRNKPGLTISNKRLDAQVVLTLLSQQVDRTVVAFSAAGRPREIQLRMRVSYRINDGFGSELSGPLEITQTRDLSINEAEFLAIGSAEAAMVEDMQRDIAQQLVRRLRAVRPPG
jgi:LPS-assembly lipoprotein